MFALGPLNRLHVGSWCGVGGRQLGRTHFLKIAWRLQHGPYGLGEVLQKQALFEVLLRKVVDLFFKADRQMCDFIRVL